MPGRLRTASRPSSTVMESAPYPGAGAGADPAVCSRGCSDMRSGWLTKLHSAQARGPRASSNTRGSRPDDVEGDRPGRCAVVAVAHTSGSAFLRRPTAALWTRVARSSPGQVGPHTGLPSGSFSAIGVARPAALHPTGTAAPVRLCGTSDLQSSYDAGAGVLGDPGQQDRAQQPELGRPGRGLGDQDQVAVHQPDRLAVVGDLWPHHRGPVGEHGRSSADLLPAALRNEPAHSRAEGHRITPVRAGAAPLWWHPGPTAPSRPDTFCPRRGLGLRQRCSHEVGPMQPDHSSPVRRTGVWSLSRHR